MKRFNNPVCDMRGMADVYTGAVAGRGADRGACIACNAELPYLSAPVECLVANTSIELVQQGHQTAGASPSPTSTARNNVRELQ